MRGFATIRTPAALAVLIVSSACGNAADPADDPATYVGREVCAQCHAAESALWRDSHHDLAMQEATPATVLGDFDAATFTHQGGTWTFRSGEDGFSVRTPGAGDLRSDVPVAYTFGADPLQQYLVPFPGGRYQALGIAWDVRSESDGGQRWFALDPDALGDASSPLHWTRPAQNWNVACADCHSTGLEVGFDVATRSFTTTWSELDVSCEACHGPGSRHVDRMGDGASATGADGGLPTDFVDPGRTWTRAPGAPVATRAAPPTSRAEVETCAQCHSRRAPIGSAYTPGEAFLDAYRPSLLREGLYHADGQIDDEVYVWGSFLQSRMFAAGVTCSDCHDPHSLHLRAEGNGLCTRCHAAERYDVPSHHHHEPASGGAACVECHMPAKTYMRVDPRRDHGLRIPRPDLARDLGTPDACSGCHADRSASWAADVAVRWWGERSEHFAETIAHGRTGDPAAFESLVRLAGDTTRPAIVRATALTLLRRYPRAAAVDALLTGLADADPLVRIGAIEGAEGLPAPALLSLALPALDDSLRAVRIEAARLLAAVPAARMAPAQAAAVANGIAEYEASLLSSAASFARVRLGDLYATLGRPADAEAAYHVALALDSTDLSAWLNLADLHRARGRDDLAESALQRALDRFPDSPDVLHSAGLLRVRQGDAAAALPLLERAAQRNDARYGYVFGVALASAGQLERAIAVLEAVLHEHPFDRDILAALVAYRRDRGEVGPAIGYAERLVAVMPDDPGAQRILEQLRAAGR